MEKECRTKRGNGRSCGKVKPLSDFYTHPHNADGYMSKCKQCHKEQLYAGRSPEQARAAAARHRKTAKWRETAKRFNESEYGRAGKRVFRSNQRAKKAGCTGYLCPNDWLDVLKVQEGICAGKDCDGPIEHMDHIVPLTLKGENTRENVQGLCRDCHNRKTYSDRKAGREAKGTG